MNRVIGFCFGVLFVLIFSGSAEWFKEFVYAADVAQNWGHFRTQQKALDGIYFVYLIAFFGVYLLIFPSHAKNKLSPKTNTQKAVITESVWVIIGYLLIGLTFGILNVFKYSF
jgi:hypothetical protein